jgi:general nucleoside transport system permease protein
MAAYAGYRLDGLPKAIHIPLCLAIGAFFGAVPAFIAGVLKAKRGAHEVIITIMLNAIVVNLTEYLAGGPWMKKGQPITRTPDILASARIGSIGKIPVGIFVALAVAVAVGFVLARTTFGFRISTVGANKDAANYAGVSVSRTLMAAMAFSGALAGLGGAIETLGVVRRFEPSFNSGLGFDGITIALLARLKPKMTIPAALLIGLMRAGASRMQARTDVEAELVDVILGLMLLFVAAPVLVRWVLRQRHDDGKDGVQLTAGWGR